jgi:hypothetical protein
MITMTVEEFNTALKAQNKKRSEDLTFRCPRCKTIQSGQDLIDAGAGASFEDIKIYLGFSCVGRFDKAKGCDWTLGGLFKIHEFEVVDDKGVHHPMFMPIAEGEEKI